MSRPELAVGVDLGGTKTLGLLVDGDARVLARREVPTPAARGPLAVLEAVAEVARELARGRSPRGVGIGVPGPLDPTTGVVHAMPNVHPGFRRYPIRERLSSLLPGLAISVENDANAAMLGEAWTGAAAGASDAILLTLGTGVGGGVVAAGRLVRGSRGVGAELGHVVVEPEGPPCGCSGRGCLEQFASGTALARLAREALAKRAEGALAALEHAPSAQDVVAAARAGDPLALAVLERAARALGVALASIVHVLNPSVAVIAGGLGAAAFDLLAPGALRELSGRTFEAAREGLALVPARLGAEAGAIGAARSALADH